MVNKLNWFYNLAIEIITSGLNVKKWDFINGTMKKRVFLIIFSGVPIFILSNSNESTKLLCHLQFLIFLIAFFSDTIAITKCCSRSTGNWRESRDCGTGRRRPNNYSCPRSSTRRHNSKSNRSQIDNTETHGTDQSQLRSRAPGR